jgi:Tol biopolymer transport system component
MTTSQLRIRLAMCGVLALLAAYVPVPGAAATHSRRSEARIAFTANLAGKSDTWQVFSMRPDGADVRQVTHLAHSTARSMFPTWAPDKRRLAFSSTVAGHVKIFVINSDGSGQRKLTRDSVDELAPAWSPDGRRIAFVRDNAIWTMNPQGTHRRRLIGASYDIFAPTYTPKSDHIVFLSSRGGLVSAVWIMRADGSHLRRLTPGWLKGLPMDVSPDGRRVLVNDNTSTNAATSIWEVNIDGTHLHRLTRAGCCYHDGNARYSPDGRTIAFVTDRWYAPRGARENEIWKMNADGHKQHVVTSSITRGGCPDALVGNCNGPISWQR